jgi:hypothetical protein
MPHPYVILTTFLVFGIKFVYNTCDIDFLHQICRIGAGADHMFVFLLGGMCPIGYRCEVRRGSLGVSLAANLGEHYVPYILIHDLALARHFAVSSSCLACSNRLLHDIS